MGEASPPAIGGEWLGGALLAASGSRADEVPGSRAEPPLGAAGRQVPVRHIRWAVAAMAGFLAFPVAELLGVARPPAVVAAGLAGIAVFGVLFVRVAWVGMAHPNEGRTTRELAGMALVALALFAVLDTTWLLTASYYIAWGLIHGRRRRWWLPGLAAVLAADVVIGLLVLDAGIGRVAGVLAQITAFGLLTWGFHRMMELSAQLRAARAEATRAAIAEERLRIARDLHDVLGQRLTEVVLKSELAARLVGRDPLRARSEMTEMAQVTRQALSEVRTTVSGYRRASLAGEITTARTLLDSAGIDLETDVPERPLPQPIDEAAAWVVREGVTNILRHTLALHCEIRVMWQDAVDPTGSPPGERMVVVTVRDDGPERVGGPQVPVRFGNGLSGVSERVAALGGRVSAGVAGGRLVLRAEIPGGEG